MNNETEKLCIQVCGSEAEIIEHAETVFAELCARDPPKAVEMSDGRSRTVEAPMVFFSNKAESEAFLKCDSLAVEYQKRYGLAKKPVLIPARETYQEEIPMAQVVFPSATQGAFPSGSRAAPTTFVKRRIELGRDAAPAELAIYFCQRVPTIVVGSRFYLWTENHYKAATDDDVKAKIKTILRAHLMGDNATSVINSVFTLLRYEECIKQDGSIPQDRIAVQNGELDLNTLQLKPPNYESGLLHYVGIPWFAYQPCPHFQRFLFETADGDQELILRILEVIGYLLVPDYRAKRFVVFQGAGDAGKSLLANLIASFFEPGAVASLADYRFGDRFAMSFIAKASLCMCLDLSGGVIDEKAVSALKQITGGDLISVEAKGRDAYSEVLRCKILFGTNARIKLKSRDQAFARRLLLIPFYHSVPPERQDHNLIEKLI